MCRGAVSAAILWTHFSVASYAQSFVSAEPGHQGRADIWGDWIVWHDNRQSGNNYNIYAKNLSTSEEIQISNSNSAFCPKIYNNSVVWQDKRNGDFDIYIFDLITRSESALYIAPGNQVNPAIFGDTVAWRTGQYPSWPEVWGYSISQSAAFLISDAPGNKWEPDVFTNIVIWGDYRNDNWDIYGYNVASQTEFVIADGLAYQRSAAVYGNTVVYENHQTGGNTGIGIYNLNTQEHKYHHIAGGCDFIDIYGAITVWSDYRNNNTDIYGYNIFTGKEFPVAKETGWQYNPAIYRNKMVWSIDTDGEYSERDIYHTVTTKTLYVKIDASGNNDGSSWDDAYNYLQDALEAAFENDDIFVSSGTYRPDEGLNQNLNDRSASFELVDGVSVWGGFSGWENSLGQRDLQTNKTILSGDIGAANLKSDNSYHVVTAGSISNDTILDGFIITAGNADGPYPDDCGGGMYSNSGAPTLGNCIFIGNSAENGAGLLLSEGTITDCTIVENTAGSYGGGISSFNGLIHWSIISNNFAGQSGGGLYNCSGSVTFSNISGNYAEYYGGGFYACQSSVTRCNITNNTTNIHGGGISSCSGPVTYSQIKGNYCGESGGGLYDCNGTISYCFIGNNTANQTGGGLAECEGNITNCTIRGNYAEYYGGGLYICQGSIIGCDISGNTTNNRGGGASHCNGLITKCTINGNQSGQTGGGLYNCNGSITNCTISNNYTTYYGGGLFGCNSSIINCIIRLNTADTGPQFYHCSEPSYSCIQDWTGGTGNIDTEPHFVQPGYWDINDTPVDSSDDFWVRGNYHLKSEAGRARLCVYIRLDPTGDGYIDLTDFAVFAHFSQRRGAFTPADLDEDGVVDLFDLSLLMDDYLTTYCAVVWEFDELTSPCIDAGSPASDLSGELWPHGKRINMGAYGGTTQAGLSLSDTGSIANLDYDNNDNVDFHDIDLLMSRWLDTEVLIIEDLNRDGEINFHDFAIFADNWLE